VPCHLPKLIEGEVGTGLISKRSPVFGHGCGKGCLRLGGCGRGGKCGRGRPLEGHWQMSAWVCWRGSTWGAPRHLDGTGARILT